MVDDAELMTTVRALAVRLASRSPSALLASRQALDAGLHNDFATQLELEAAGQTALGREPAFSAAVQAFLARRSRKT